jgi:hypothetical protein
VNNLPSVRLLLIPPVLASIVVGAGSGLIALGFAMRSYDISTAGSIAIIWTGCGILVGFLWGGLVWSDKILQAYQPKIYETNTQKQSATIRIELVGDNQVDWVDMPDGIDVEQLISLATLVKQNNYNFGHSLSGPGRPLSRSQYETLRDLLVSRGLAKWINPNGRNQGVVLLHPGRALFKELTLRKPESAGLLRYLGDQ